MSAGRSVDAAAQAVARTHERRVLMASHPVVYLLSGLAARLGPVVSVPRLGHLVTDPVLAREVLSSPARFAKTGPGALSDTLSAVLGRQALVNMDGEAHRELRARLQGLFAPAETAALVQREFAAPLTLLGERLRSGQRVDLVKLARVLTGRIACAIVGVPLPPGREEATCLELHRSAARFTALLTLTGRRPQGHRLDIARQRFDALTGVARQAYDSGDERCVPGRLRALGFDFESCRGVIGLLLLAGTETTASALPRIVALLVDSGQWRLLRERRDLLQAALDEGLRLTAALPAVTRNVVAPTRLGGRALRADERVIVLLFKALTSPALLADPLRFDIERDRAAPLAPLWFGAGPHFCLGAALARQQLGAALGTLLDSGDLVVVGRRHAGEPPLPGYGRLDVVLAAASASPPASMNPASERSGR